MPPISMPGANRAELNVNSNTSLQDLVKFQSKAAEKGYGEIRARQNKDGSVTLYMPANKGSLTRVFGQSWGKDARAQKRDLATATVKDILRNHLQASLPDKGVGSVPARAWTNALLARLDQPIRNSHLGDALTETASLHQTVLQAAHDDAEKISPAIAGHFKNIDVILSEPALAPKLGAFMAKQFTTENFTFLTGLEGYGKVQEPAEKMRLAEALFKMIESPENPPMSKGSIGKLGDTHKNIQVNISSDAAKLIFKDIQNLRTQMAAGGITSREDKSVLDKLFQAAGKEIKKLSAADLNNFIETPEFKAGVGEILISRPFYAAVPEFTSLEKVLADPQMFDAFQAHLASDEGLQQRGKSETLTAAFDRFNQIESLAAMPASRNTQADLIAQIDLLLNGPAPAAAPSAAPAGPAADEVASLDSDDAVAPATRDPATRDPVTESFSRRLDVIKQMAQGSTISLPKDQGGIPYSLVWPLGAREAAGLKSLLKDMGGDAANPLRRDALQSFIGSPLMQAVLAERNPQPGAEKNHGSFEPFAGGPTAKVGGQSGSVQTEVKGQKYQLKFDIANSSWTRRAKAGGLNTENDSEMISANILHGMRGETTKALLPEVGLRQNSANNQTVVTSKYLQGGKGNLDQFYEATVGPLFQKHIKVAVNSSEKNGNGVLHLSGQASQDVLNNLVERALVADHDVNVGNAMVVEGKLNAVEGKRIGQIDFGHAFNDLINGFGGKATGGGVRFENNRILDFFNRETVSGNPFKPGAQDSKLWRDYTGVGPSAGMTEALRSLANNTKSLVGLDQAKAAYIDLINNLRAENTPAATAQMNSQLASLAKISANVGQMKVGDVAAVPEASIVLANTAPSEVVEQAFQALSDFITTGQQQMRDVADLSALQTRIESFVTNQDPASKIPADILAKFNEIAPTLRTADGTGLTWMKQEKAVPGFVGSLDSYVASRRAQLHPADRAGAAIDVSRRGVVLADFKKRALEAGTGAAVRLLMAEPKGGVVRTAMLKIAKEAFVAENLLFMEALSDMRDEKQSLSVNSAARGKLIAEFIAADAPSEINLGPKVKGSICAAQDHLNSLGRPNHVAREALQFLLAQNCEYGPLPAAVFYKPVADLVVALGSAAPKTEEIDRLEANSIGASPEPFQEMRDQLSRLSQIKISQLQNAFIKEHLGEGSPMAERISPQLKQDILDLQEQDGDNGEPQSEVINALSAKLKSIPNDLMAGAAASPNYQIHAEVALNNVIDLNLQDAEVQLMALFGVNSLGPGAGRTMLFNQPGWVKAAG